MLTELFVKITDFVFRNKELFSAHQIKQRKKALSEGKQMKGTTNLVDYITGVRNKRTMSSLRKMPYLHQSLLDPNKHPGSARLFDIF